MTGRGPRPEARLTLQPVRRLPEPGDGFVTAAQTVTERGEALILSVEPRGAEAVWSKAALAARRRPDGTVAAKGRTVSGHVWRIAALGDAHTRWHHLEEVDLAFPLIDMLPDGRLLMAGARMALVEHGAQGANACVVDPRHGTRVALSFGDAINGLAVDAAGRIWVSYCDEGVFASIAPDDEGPASLSLHGLVCLDAAGEALWRYPQQDVLIDDCYAMNVTGEGVWAFAYADFALIHVGAGFACRTWSTGMEGSGLIAVAEGHVLFGPQYQEAASSFHLARLDATAAVDVAAVTVGLADGVPMAEADVIARGGVLHAFARGTWYRAPMTAIEDAAGRPLSLTS